MLRRSASPIVFRTKERGVPFVLARAFFFADSGALPLPNESCFLLLFLGLVRE